MGFLDGLETLLGVDLSGVKSIGLKVRLLSDNKIESIVKVDNRKQLSINIGAEILKDQSQKKEVQNLIRAAVAEEGMLVLEETVAEQVKEIAAGHEYDEILDYFRGKIPSVDMPILRAAMFMRIVHNKGQPVDHLKQDIIDRYGQCGGNMSNLCSAGYFESHIRPMYEELETRPNFTQQLFVDNYNLIIEKAPFAIFVGSSKSLQKLLEELEGKINTNRMYGIRQLNIHAIGHENVAKLKQLIAAPESLSISRMNQQ